MPDDNGKEETKVFTTSHRQFELFRDEFLKWKDRFGLQGWEVFFEQSDAGETMACIRVGNTLLDRNASVVLNHKWQDYPPTDYACRKSGFHEACELLLFRIAFLASARYICQEDVKEEIHHLVRVLENVLFKEEESEKTDSLYFSTPARKRGGKHGKGKEGNTAAVQGI